jgi:hypothetical protein
MTDSLGAKLLLAGAIPLILAAATVHPVPGVQAACRADNLVPWNCAYGFSGSFEWKSILKGGALGGVQVDIKEDVTIGIQAGKASCLGTRAGTRRTEDGETQITKTIKGPGLVAVEYGTNTVDDPKGPYYRVTVACPSPAGEEISTDFRTGTRTVIKVLGGPPDGFSGSEMSSYKRAGTERDAVLQGSTVDEHPEADVANGLTGTVTVTWKLTRDKRP